MTRVDGVAKLLIRQPLPRDIDDLEPVQLFLVRALANVDHELVVQHSFGDLGGGVCVVRGIGMKGIGENGVVVGQPLADRDGALLTVQHLIGAVLVLRPVHDVQREVMEDGIHDRRPLFVVVDELPLIGGTDVEQPPVGHDLPALVVVAVAVEDLADGDLMEFYFHVFFSLLVFSDILSCH